MVACNNASDPSANAINADGLQSSYGSTDTSLEEPKFENPKDGEDVAVITTKFGKIVCKFRPDLAPKHVENFETLAKKGFYDHTTFHRIIPGFMIQGGDPNTKDKSKVAEYGQGGPGYQVKAEFNNLDHKRGVLSMARGGDPDSAGSQFFICVADHPDLNRKYTAFGEVVSGMDVADKIVDQPRGTNDLPNERIEMSVKIEKWPVK
ncbi:MAG: peptidylprolyl isomerase [Armatimonadetes bacterium]|nr:peptidylprolyl isomerase [Armatimonadota bacterium]MBS1726326.1 peptidylprolyl isomerase [Armatimonadota bacterium]